MSIPSESLRRVGSVGLMVWADWKRRAHDGAKRTAGAQRRAAEAKLRRRLDR